MARRPGCAFPVRVDPDDLASVVVIDAADFVDASGAEVLAIGRAVRIDPGDPGRVAFDWAVSSPRGSER